VTIGTKSVLFGAHQFILHPIVLFIAWWQIFRFPWDPRLWVLFFIHDLGYVGKPNMDGPEGETHVEFGANLIGRLFGDSYRDLALYHSRFYAKREGKSVSDLCIADKHAIILMPTFLYLFLTNLTGEVHEYMSKAKDKYIHENLDTASQREWFESVKEFLGGWIQQELAK